MQFQFNGVINGELSDDVLIDGQPAAVQDSTAQNIPPHVPTGGVFQRPPSNSGRIVSGSTTVLINGKPAARDGDTAMTCNDPSDAIIGAVEVARGSVEIG
jgi:uncharacterized Zn-binding protein involved in type VI secretion